ncbi:U11/U12 small nuclear ribonucleoprotein 25 kDa protein [Quillaja saponaria]|uniref:U11/U12 small nuclear ribonucleoprotein 25 kDa protein n=1 Tax=Quillaja saponaria TaxID=32244 RepID=A0AAD7QCF4_QUISA|nr:U11/U12 small nuclear ribonucleoprotein 25 kDa protein [Quillaja saponaria]
MILFIFSIDHHLQFLCKKFTNSHNAENKKYPSLSPFLRHDSLRRSLAYHKLPQPCLNLSVLKLDGSCFDVQVPRTAKVAELKEAVERVFSQLQNHREITVSWSHVWGHFCLCYNDQKLVDDKAYIGLYGIHDGDQLRFVRHLSFNYMI